MTKKIFRSIFLSAITVSLVTLLVITGYIYNYFGGLQEEELRDELNLIAAASEQVGTEYLEKLSVEHSRLTWIAADGTVLYDTQVDASSMENHAGREEVREALSTGKGSSSRYSSTLTEKTVYEAVRLSDGSVLRISVSRATAATLVLEAMRPFALIAIMAALLSGILAERMANRVVKPLNTLDLEKPLENDVYEELSPLLRRIHSQQREIESQMKNLRQKQEEFDQITLHMKEGLILLDKNGKVVSINPSARILFGTDFSCVGQDFLSISRKQDMRCALRSAFELGHYAFRTELEGREYQFDLSSIQSEGAVYGMVILGFDVTDQVNAERSRQEFTANVSHELKTPLQSIIGSAELLENGMVKSQDIPRFVGHIRKEASRLVTLIEDIIRLSRLDEGGEMPLEEVSLRTLTEEAFSELQDIAQTRNISLSVAGECIIYGVRRLLFEIICNLCDNAVKYNVDGGSVRVNLSQSEKEAIISVEDTGIGIAPEHQSRVFERFYRVDKSHSKQSGGTGLGLSIVKHAVQYHRGKIELFSREGNGTTITLTFPIQ